jgi:uncharacterized protein
MIDPPEYDEPGLVRPMSVWAAVGWALGTYFLYLMVAVFAISLREGASRDVITLFGCQLIAYLFGLFGILRLYAPQASIRDLTGLRATHTLAYPIAILLGGAILLPVNELYTVIVERFPAELPADELVETLRASSPVRVVATGVVFVLLVPILEETFYRGALFRPLLRSMGPRGAIVVTSLLFASAHETRAILPIALAGAVLGFARWQSGSVVCSMLLHMTFNAVPFYEAVQQSAQTGEVAIEHAPVEWVALSALVAAAIVVFSLRLGPRTEAVRHAQERDRT